MYCRNSWRPLLDEVIAEGWQRMEQIDIHPDNEAVLVAATPDCRVFAEPSYTGDLLVLWLDERAEARHWCECLIGAGAVQIANMADAEAPTIVLRLPDNAL